MMNWNLDHSYTQLPSTLYTDVLPTPVKTPTLVLFNAPLAHELGLGPSDENTAAELAGNQLPPGARPIAQAYAGHQFGQFTKLGDGRAILLGEQLTPTKLRYDIQLKGSGSTPYSRRGDGRATLPAMLREYLISEAMHGLGIPTTRSLAVTLTGEVVYRERLQMGGVLTRVAASHIRTGTFEYAANFEPKETLQALFHYTLNRHYPALLHEEQPALAFLKTVWQAQAKLVANWARVGFIHGVMNTDNMSLAVETIDYGPCAFMNVYDPATVFSSIDQQGRYAFGNQPFIMQWNGVILARTLLALIHDNARVASEQAQELIHAFPDWYQAAWLETMRKKLGLTEPDPQDETLIADLLSWMQAARADYTNTFLVLEGRISSIDARYTADAFLAWKKRWYTRLGIQASDALPASTLQLMQQANPTFIPRNHLVESALEEAGQHNRWEAFQQLLARVQHPYRNPEDEIDRPYTTPPPPTAEAAYQTFCGT